MVEREKIFKITEGKCFYCGCNIKYEDFHIDHFIPKSKNGGKENNIVPSCPTCNLIKGDLLLEDFRKKIENLAYEERGKIGIMNKYYKIQPQKIIFYFENLILGGGENDGRK